MEHIQKVFMRLPQCEIQTKCTVVLQKTVSRLNKQGAWLHLDVGEFVEQRKVIKVQTPRHQQNRFPGTRKKLIYI